MVRREGPEAAEVGVATPGGDKQEAEILGMTLVGVGHYSARQW